MIPPLVVVHAKTFRFRWYVMQRAMRFFLSMWASSKKKSFETCKYFCDALDDIVVGCGLHAAPGAEMHEELRSGVCGRHCGVSQRVFGAVCWLPRRMRAPREAGRMFFRRGRLLGLQGGRRSLQRAWILHAETVDRLRVVRGREEPGSVCGRATSEALGRQALRPHVRRDRCRVIVMSLSARSTSSKARRQHFSESEKNIHVTNC